MFYYLNVTKDFFEASRQCLRCGITSVPALWHHVSACAVASRQCLRCGITSVPALWHHFISSSQSASCNHKEKFYEVCLSLYAVKFTAMTDAKDERLSPASKATFQDYKGPVQDLLDQHLEVYRHLVDVVPQDTRMPASYMKYHDQYQAFKSRPTDIWVASYPKSGTTWTQELVWCLLFTLQSPHLHDLLPARSPFFEWDGLFPEGMTLDHLPDKDPNKTGVMWTLLNESLPDPRVIKTHMNRELLPCSVDAIKPKIVYVCRDPRDVCVSYYHHAVKLEGFTGDFDTFVKIFLADALPWAPFWSNVLSYWNRRDESNVLFLTFEELKTDMPGVLKRVAKFLGITRGGVEGPLSFEEVAALTEHLSFSSMSKNPATNNEGLMTAAIRTETSHGIKFMREGKSLRRGKFKARAGLLVVSVVRKVRATETGLRPVLEKLQLICAQDRCHVSRTGAMCPGQVPCVQDRCHVSRTGAMCPGQVPCVQDRCRVSRTGVMSPGQVSCLQDRCHVSRTGVMSPGQMRRLFRSLRNVSTTKHPASVMMFGVVASNGGKMPQVWFPRGYRLNTSAYKDDLVTKILTWVHPVPNSLSNLSYCHRPTDRPRNNHQPKRMTRRTKTLTTPNLNNHGKHAQRKKTKKWKKACSPPDKHRSPDTCELEATLVKSVTQHLPIPTHPTNEWIITELSKKQHENQG
ncbi:Sulfotransferase domain [Trinorchestia longiramus]|nr:Sulfotransferase domain [Trinorchestia longiramus]